MQNAVSINFADDYARSEADYVAIVTEINTERRAELHGLQTQIKNEIAEEIRMIGALSEEVECLAQKQEIGNKQTKIVTLRAQLRKVEKKFDTILIREDDLCRQFQTIWNTPRIRSVAIVGTRIGYRTLPLFGRDHLSYWRRIGPFDISFCMKNPTLDSFVWRNLEGPINQMHGPPNISETVYTEYGVVHCAGDGYEVIERAADINDFPSLVAFSVRYPECAGQEDNPTILSWPKVPWDKIPSWYRKTFAENASTDAR